MSARQMEMEYGKHIAEQLKKADAKKEFARLQTSRFQSLAEEEKIAKRDRKLADLEAQDAAEEKMEALTSIKVMAWRCRDCVLTTESEAVRALCQQNGHQVDRVQAERTRWECKGCRWSAMVLDRELPQSCNKCNGYAWQQVPLRCTRRAAPMERDFLLARGEELPYLNSIAPQAGQPAFKRFKEAEDDYAGL